MLRSLSQVTGHRLRVTSAFLVSRLSFILLLFFFFSSCQNSSKRKSGDYFNWRDAYGREVSLKEEPQRVVSLSPALTEMIFLLESENKLVAITDFCLYPPETDNILKVGGIQNFNIESVIALNPDVVLIGSIVPQESVNKMESMGLSVIAIKEENKIEGIYKAMIVLGEILNQKEMAAKKVEDLQQRIADIERREVSEQEKPSIYYVVGFGEAGDFTAPKDSHIHEIITLAGGRNIGEVLTGWSISREYLFQEDPDLIFVREEDVDHFSQLFPYTELTAVKNKRVYPIESGWIDIVSPRNVLAVEEISKRIKGRDVLS